jgi:hypothetical protein
MCRRRRSRSRAPPPSGSSTVPMSWRGRSSRPDVQGGGSLAGNELMPAWSTRSSSVSKGSLTVGEGGLRLEGSITPNVATLLMIERHQDLVV